MGGTYPSSLHRQPAGLEALWLEPETPFRMSIPFTRPGPGGAGPGGSHQDKSARVARLATNDAANSRDLRSPRCGDARSPTHVRTRPAREQLQEEGWGRDHPGPRPPHPALPTAPNAAGRASQPGLSELVAFMYGWHRRLNAVEGS